MRIRLTAFLLATFLVLAACGGGAEETTTTTTTAAGPVATPATSTTTTTRPPESTTTTEPAPVGFPSPLNGVYISDEALVNRRVLAVKIDNHWNARPQSGLQDADAVYELLVEAGLTRFISLFLQSDSTYLGPMRSGRPTDPTLLSPLGATFTISGAQAWVQARIRSAGVSLIGEEPPAAYRVGFRDAPHNLYVDTNLLRDIADARGYSDAPPVPMFSFGPTVSTDRATNITFDWSDDMEDVTWRFDGTNYERIAGSEPQTVWPFKENFETEQTITADSIVVLFAERYTACPTGDATGSCVPAMDTVGTGRALVFSGGTVAQGQWSRSNASSPFALSTPAGAELPVPAGKLWIAVFPNGRSVSW